jgi:hypothetical protein
VITRSLPVKVVFWSDLFYRGSTPISGQLCSSACLPRRPRRARESPTLRTYFAEITSIHPVHNHTFLGNGDSRGNVRFSFDGTLLVAGYVKVHFGPGDGRNAGRCGCCCHGAGLLCGGARGHGGTVGGRPGSLRARWSGQGSWRRAAGAAGDRPGWPASWSALTDDVKGCDLRCRSSGSWPRVSSGGGGAEAERCKVSRQRRLPRKTRPPMPFSPIPAARSQHFIDLLAQVPDPRKRRGRRHPLAGLLAVGVAAVIAGSRSFAAIGLPGPGQ